MDTAPPRKGNRWDNQTGKHNWKAAARKVQRSPEEWVLVAKDVSSGTAQNVRDGKIIPLRDLGGVMKATVRNSRMEGATRYGDLYLMWSPVEEESSE